eukprot:TRINITY_DN6380_c0_g1_i1.p1 TRINITY_DN6380_c0_g1~~TRINITY_DN6380_c0_g1_i1.p1  ORF type:complete len:521 (-),score=50.93 TRINITY_DN6380_c0_g1_i1:24-1586(-)
MTDENSVSVTSTAKKFSCNRCKKWHLKCDQNRPSCGTCEEKNVVCLYERKTREGSTILMSDAKKIEQELEHYRKLTAYWQEKTQYLSQELQVLKNSDSQLAIESAGTFKLHNSLLFNNLLDIYMLEEFPKNEIRPPYTNLESFSQQTDLSPQKGLMYSILANSSSLVGDLNLYKQLEHEAKVALGPWFDNTNLEVAASHFIISEAHIFAGDVEKAEFYREIAKRTAIDYCKKNKDKTEAKHMQNLVNFMTVTYLSTQPSDFNLEFGLKIVNEFYDSCSTSLSGNGETKLHRIGIIWMKVLLEIRAWMKTRKPISMRDYNRWIVLMDEADQNIKTVPNEIKRNVIMNHESLRSLLYHVGNQPQFLRQTIHVILEAALMPCSASNYWPAKSLMMTAGMCLVYNWPEEFQKAYEMLELHSKHPSDIIAKETIKNAVEQFGSTMSFSQFAELLKRNFSGKGFHPKYLEGSSTIAIEELSSSASSPLDPILPDLTTSPMEQMLGEVAEPFSFDFDNNANQFVNNM